MRFLCLFGIDEFYVRVAVRRNRFVCNKINYMHLVGFIIKKSVTMHGHMNVKFVNAKQAKEP
jgi:hypothetical protein